MLFSEYKEKDCSFEKHKNVWGKESMYSVIAANSETECTDACLKDDECAEASIVFDPAAEVFMCHLYNIKVKTEHRNNAVHLVKQCSGNSLPNSSKFFRSWEKKHLKTLCEKMWMLTTSIFLYF